MWIELSVFGAIWTINPELRLLILVSLASAAGNLIRSTWGAIINPPGAVHTMNTLVAAALGVVFVLIMSQVLTDAKGVGDVNLSGMLIMASMVGFVSDQVTAKLQNFFSGFFTAAEPTVTSTARLSEAVEAVFLSEEMLGREASLRGIYGRNPSPSVAKELIDVLKQLKKFDEAASIYDVLISANPEEQ